MPMGRKMALLDFGACHPDACPEGACAAAAACPSRLLKQEKPYETHIPEPFACRACGECVRACPNKAVSIVTM